MKSNTVGDLARQCRLIDSHFVDSGSPDVEMTFVNEHMDGIGLQLVSGGERDIVVLEGDNVDNAGNWTFGAGNFTENDLGGTITIAGSASNNGTFTITTVTGPTEITTSGVTVTEAFDPANVTALIVQLSPAGTWTFLVSNTFTKGTASERQTDGAPWTPINDQFSPSIQTVSEQYVPDTANSANQYVQAYPLVARAGKIKFHRTSGSGPVSAYRFQKGNH